MGPKWGDLVSLEAATHGRTAEVRAAQKSSGTQEPKVVEAQLWP